MANCEVFIRSFRYIPARWSFDISVVQACHGTLKVTLTLGLTSHLQLPHLLSPIPLSLLDPILIHLRFRIPLSLPALPKKFLHAKIKCESLSSIVTHIPEHRLHTRFLIPSVF